jgi:hypothetical protein
MGGCLAAAGRSPRLGAEGATEKVLKSDRPRLPRADRLHGDNPSASQARGALHELPDEQELVPTVQPFAALGLCVRFLFA